MEIRKITNLILPVCSPFSMIIVCILHHHKCTYVHTWCRESEAQDGVKEWTVRYG